MQFHSVVQHSIRRRLQPAPEVSHFCYIGWRINRKALLPSFLKEGAAAPHQLMCRNLKLRRSGGGLYLDLNHPGRAELKVAWHLLVRRGHPSFKRRGERFVLSQDMRKQINSRSRLQPARAATAATSNPQFFGAQKPGLSPAAPASTREIVMLF